jgi:hypothetical protein
LESSFGLDKQLERQHSQSGFTSLIATFGALLRPTTPVMIRSDFERVKMKDVRDWLQKKTAEDSDRQTPHDLSRIQRHSKTRNQKPSR